MIRYITNDCIDKTRWDDCVEHALNGNVYAWSWYLDVVHPGWEALVEIEDDKYLTIMPITRKRKYSINYLCQPFFVQQLGVFSRKPITEETTKAFLRAIPKKYRLVEIRLNEQNPLPEGRKGVDWHRNYLLDLNKDYNSLLSEYHSNTIRNLKKSLKYGLELVKGVDLQIIIDLFRANRGAAIKHWGDAEYARLKRLTEVALSSSNAFVYGIKISDNDEIICGGLFMKSHQRISFLFSGRNDAAKECHAMTYLVDQIIRENAAQPLTLDFEGSDDENLARFFHGFGAKQVSYPGFNYRIFNPLRYFS